MDGSLWYMDTQKPPSIASLCARRQSELRELALTGRYCRVHLASVQFAPGYEPIDIPFSTPWARVGYGRHCHPGIRLVTGSMRVCYTKSPCAKDSERESENINIHLCALGEFDVVLGP